MRGGPVNWATVPGPRQGYVGRCETRPAPISSARPTRLVVISGLLAASLLGCGGDGGEASAAPGSGEAVVELEGLEFSPDRVKVEAGQAVRWVWTENVAHDVTAEDFASETQSSGEYTHTFDEPGTYDYVCKLHPGMDGTVEVS